MKKRDIVQLKNPKSGKYVKMDRTVGKIISHKKSLGPYKNISIVKNKLKKSWAEYSRVKCNCGHYPKDHYQREGCCDKCGCTWYYPNDKYLAKKKKEE